MQSSSKLKEREPESQWRPRLRQALHHWLNRVVALPKIDYGSFSIKDCSGSVSSCIVKKKLLLAKHMMSSFFSSMCSAAAPILYVALGLGQGQPKGQSCLHVVPTLRFPSLQWMSTVGYGGGGWEPSCSTSSTTDTFYFFLWLSHALKLMWGRKAGSLF